MRVVLDKVDMLSPIDPSLLASEIEALQAEAFVLGRFPNPDFLMYEGQSRSVIGFSSCLDPENDCLNPNAAPVKLHYSSSGLKEAQNAPQAAVDLLVPPIVLKNGWILAFDTNTRNILGFRQVDGYRERNANVLGAPNFGRGNGVLLTVVVTGEDIDAQLGSNIVSRMVEIEDNRVLLFFESLPAVHLLELGEQEKLLAHDLSRPQESVIPTTVLRGDIIQFLRNPNLPEGPSNPREPLLQDRDISDQITSVPDVAIDRFEPVVVPTDGSVLLFDAETANFFRMSLRRVGGEIVGSTLALAVSNTAMFNVLVGTAGVTSTAELDISRSFFHATEPEICFLEESTTTILCYNYTEPPAANPNNLNALNIRAFVDSNSIVFAFDPQGASEDVGGSDPSLIFASDDVEDNRIAFDKSRNLLLSISYRTSNVVVMARRSDLVGVTGDALVDLTQVITLDNNNLRAFDAQSVSLLEIPLDYEAFPITITN